MSMGRKVMGLGFMVGAFSLAAVAAPNDASADIQLREPLLVLATPVPITCMNPGSQQDVSKTPILKNTTAATIKKGHVLTWKSTDGDHGSLRLDADLAPNAAVSTLGHPGNGYSCTASFLSNADLTIKTASFGSGGNEVVVELQNLSPWVDAQASVVHVDVMACGGQVLASADSAPMAMAKSSTKTFAVTLPPTSGRRYLRVKADAGNAVVETDEANNLFDQSGSCIR